MMEDKGVVLADVLGSYKFITLFTSLLREFPDIERRITNAGLKTTLLAPQNLAIERGELKTWERKEDYDTYGPNAYEGEEGRARAKENNRQFILSHIVTDFPWINGKMTRTMAGRDIYWEDVGGRRTIHPDGIEILHPLKRTVNGDVWLIAGIIGPHAPVAE